jgi:hypothetical protein
MSATPVSSLPPFSQKEEEGAGVVHFQLIRIQNYFMFLTDAFLHPSSL